MDIDGSLAFGFAACPFFPAASGDNGAGHAAPSRRGEGGEDSADERPTAENESARLAARGPARCSHHKLFNHLGRQPRRTPRTT